MKNSSAKIRYEIDPHNRLVYRRSGKKSGIAGFRTVLGGQFGIGPDNQLIYHVKRSSDAEPQQVKLKGTWRLDAAHNLVLTLDKWGNQVAGNKLTIQSELIGAESGRLAFAVTSKDSRSATQIYILKLSGQWQADKRNRLFFDVRKESGRTDRLHLSGGWSVNAQNQIVYRFERTIGARVNRTVKSVTLKGYWDIPGPRRLFYVVDTQTGEGITVTVSVGRPVSRGLQYEAGVTAGTGSRTITLFGTWKLSPTAGMLFEMAGSDGSVHRVMLGGTLKFGSGGAVEMRLQNRAAEDLGITLKLSRRLVRLQGEGFIRLLRERTEISVTAGVGFRW